MFWGICVANHAKLESFRYLKCLKSPTVDTNKHKINLLSFRARRLICGAWIFKSPNRRLCRWLLILISVKELCENSCRLKQNSWQISMIDDMREFASWKVVCHHQPSTSLHIYAYKVMNESKWMNNKICLLLRRPSPSFSQIASEQSVRRCHKEQMIWTSFPLWPYMSFCFTIKFNSITFRSLMGQVRESRNFSLTQMIIWWLRLEISFEKNPFPCNSC